MPNDFLGFFQGDSKQFLDLADWRGTHGWDKDSSAGDLQIAFNPDTLELTMNNTQPLPKANVVHQIDCDMLGKVTGETRAPGPLADASAKASWHVDPRKLA